MKKLLLILGLLSIIFVCHAQQDSATARTVLTDSSFAGSKATILLLDSAVGYTISQAEKTDYHLFPYIPSREFHAAEFFRLPDNSIVLVIQKSDSTTRIVNYSITDYKSSAYLVRYYSGRVKPADDLSPETTYYLIKGTIDLLDIFIQAKCNGK